MNRRAFERYLYAYRQSNGQALTDKAIAFRLRKADEAERLLIKNLGQNFDQTVANDQNMRRAVIFLRSQPGAARHNPCGNVLRKYYAMVHGREFPMVRS